MEETLKKLQEFLKHHIPENKLIILPFSGGLNSTTILGVLRTVYPSDQIFLFHGSSDLNKIETLHAKKIADQFKVVLHIFDATKIKQSYKETLALVLDSVKRTDDKYSREVLEVTDMSNVIHSLSRSISRETSGVLIGMIDLDEILTGYFAKDCYAGDFLPMGGLFRSELRELAKVVGVKDFLPEKWASFPGCGNLPLNVTEKIKLMHGTQEFSNESELIQELDLFIRGLPHQTTEISSFIKTQLHKIRTVLLGRPVFFADSERRAKIYSFLNTE